MSRERLEGLKEVMTGVEYKCGCMEGSSKWDDLFRACGDTKRSLAGRSKSPVTYVIIIIICVDEIAMPHAPCPYLHINS